MCFLGDLMKNKLNKNVTAAATTAICSPFFSEREISEINWKILFLFYQSSSYSSPNLRIFFKSSCNIIWFMLLLKSNSACFFFLTISELLYRCFGAMEMWLACMLAWDARHPFRFRHYFKARKPRSLETSTWYHHLRRGRTRRRFWFHASINQLHLSERFGSCQPHAGSPK